METDTLHDVMEPKSQNVLQLHCEPRDFIRRQWVKSKWQIKEGSLQTLCNVVSTSLSNQKY